MLLQLYYYIILGFWFLFTVYLLVNKTRVGWLKNVTPLTSDLPSVAIIIAVRNEERDLENALQSVCNLHYNNYRIYVINDRSTDRTGQILADFKKNYTHIEVHNIAELPKGWLGKNYALYQGYANTDQEWMLFTDADVVFQPDALAKAMNYVLLNEVDHLTILPDVKSRSTWLNSILSTFVLLLEGKHQPWALRNKRNKTAYLGIGAFNLINRAAYEKLGTHKAFPLRPDDDLLLGKRLKESGGRQDALYGKGEVGLEWYPSVKEFINGLMKNSFSAFKYQFGLLLIMGVLPMLLFFVLPLPLMLATGFRVYAVFLMLTWLVLFAWSIGSNTRWWHAFIVPIAGGLMIYILLKAGLKAKRQKGIYWRESFYSLKDLRSGL